jgi:hypothetical protein
MFIKCLAISLNPPAIIANRSSIPSICPAIQVKHIATCSNRHTISSKPPAILSVCLSIHLNIVPTYPMPATINIHIHLSVWYNEWNRVIITLL